MSYTAKLLDAIKRDTGWKITVEFTDGADVRTEAYQFAGTTLKQLKDFVRREATKLSTIKSADFSAYIGNSVDLTITPTPPTAAEIAKAAWFGDWRQLKQIQSVFAAIPNLATTTNLQIATDLKVSLETNWLNSYLGDI